MIYFESIEAITFRINPDDKMFCDVKMWFSFKCATLLAPTILITVQFRFIVHNLDSSVSKSSKVEIDVPTADQILLCSCDS